MIDISKETYLIPCPSCETKVKVSIEQVANGSTVKCRKGHSIKLLDEGGSHNRTIRNMNSSFARLQKTLKRIGG